MSYFISATASVLSLGAICVDRYLSVTHPTKYRGRMNLTKCLLISSLIWITSFSVPMLFFVVGYMPYLMIFAHTGVVVTLGIMVFTYFRVYKTIQDQAEKLRCKEFEHSSQSKADMERSKTSKGQRKAERRITVAFLTMLGVFSVCYIPVIAMIYVLMFCPQCNCMFRHVLRDLQFLFAITNSAVNPFVCTMRLRPFRMALKAMFGLEGRENKYSVSDHSSSTLSKSGY